MAEITANRIYLPDGLLENYTAQDPIDRINSLQGSERENYIHTLQKIGILAPTDEGVLTEYGQSIAQSAIQLVEGVGKTAEEFGLGSGLKDWAGETLANNQQWRTPENLSTASYIARALGSATGTSAAILPAAIIDTVAGSKGIVTFATLFAFFYTPFLHRQRILYIRSLFYSTPLYGRKVKLSPLYQAFLHL